MTNLAKRVVMIEKQEKDVLGKGPVQKGDILSNKKKICKNQNVIYGYFNQTDGKAVEDNIKKMRKAEVKAGFSLGLKLFTSALSGVISSQAIFEWQNIRTEHLPSFIFVLMWAACAGSTFCVTGLLRNLIYTAFRK